MKIIILLLLSSLSMACLTMVPPKSKHKNSSIDFLTARQPAQAMSPDFGGPASSHWIEETWIANAVVRELRLGEANKDAVDVSVSLPMILDESIFHPYGDGQTNAHAHFGTDWKLKSPPVIMRTEVTKDQHRREILTFDPSLGAIPNIERIEKDGFIYVRPKGWKDWFVFSHASNVLSYDEFQNGLPKNFRFSDGRSFPDPEKIKSKITADKTPATVFAQFKFGPGYNQVPYPTENTHGIFPDENGFRTATGRGKTWLIDHGASPIKHIYTCFEGRNAEQEKLLGVPSGSGWHKIGDAAETILNSLEAAPLLVGVGYSVHGNPPSDSMAYGLRHTAVFKFLKPNEVVVTQRDQFHWYANTEARPFCGEIWVHDCVPNLQNSWGFNCH